MVFDATDLFETVQMAIYISDDFPKMLSTHFAYFLSIIIFL